MSLTTSRAGFRIARATKPMAAALMIGTTGAEVRSASASTPTEADSTISVKQTVLGPMPDNQQAVALSKDASHVMLLSNAGTRQVVYIDGNEGQPCSSVQLASPFGQGDSTNNPRSSSLMISPDATRFAYVASRGPNTAMMVLNGKEGPTFERIAIGAFAPVGHRLAYAGQKDKKTYIVVDGTISRPYQYALELQFSPDGQHVGYAGQDESQSNGDVWHAVIDGKEQPGYKQVANLHFSKTGGHCAYVGRTANSEEYCLVYDGKPGPKYQIIQTIALNDDGTHCAYVACKMPEASPTPTMRVQKWVAVIDGQEGPVFQQIAAIVLSPDGKHCAYSSTDNAASGAVNYAVVDGKKSLDYTFCGTFTWSPDSQHLAYVAMNNGKYVVVYDGKEQTAYNQLDQQSLQFTADSKRFGYLAAAGDGWHAVIDGKAGLPRPAIEPRSFAFSPDGQHFRFNTRGADEWFVIVDDAPSPKPGDEEVGTMALTPDGKHIAIVTVKDVTKPTQSMHVSLDGKPTGPDCVSISNLKMSDDGAHYACIGVIAEEGGKSASHIVHDGAVGLGFMRIDTLTLSADGKHVACAGYAPDGRKTLVIDGFTGPTYDEILTITGDCPQAMQFRGDGSLDYLAVMDKNLNRFVVPADAINNLPKPVASNTPSAAGYGKVYEFGAAKDDGAKPAAVAVGPDGTIYGATTEGGEFKKGVLFSVKPDGSGYRILHPFEGSRGDGAYPTSLWVARDGSVSGSLSGEGAGGYGVVFHCGGDGSGYAVAHAFTGNKDGGGPVIYAVDSDGAMYGISGRDRTPLHLFRVKPDGSDFKIVYEAPSVPGGVNDTGVGPFVDGGDGFFYGVADLNIYKVKKDGTGYAVVRTFNGPPRDISMADRAPILGSDGLLYGFASSGGKSTGGVLYKIARDGSGYSMFFDPAEVLSPRAIAEGPDGKIYVLADKGLACVNKDGSEFTILQELAGGYFPWSAAIHNGVFYAATSEGGKGGFVFRYGIGGTGAVAAAATPPTVTYQIVPPTPIDGNVEIPAASL